MDQPHHEDPSPGRRLLSRLRGRTTELVRSRLRQPAAGPPAGREVAAEEPAQPPDEGWVHHESEGGVGFTGWLYHYADGTMAAADGTVYEHTGSGAVVDATPEPEPEPEPEPDPEPHSAADEEPVPGFVQYSPSDLPAYALGAVLVLASIAAVLTLFVVVPDPGAGGFVLVLCLGVLAALAGWALARWSPTVVSVREGILEVTRGAGEDTFDLRDPGTRVVLGTNPGSPSWRTTLTDPDGRSTIIGARHVKVRQFTRIVEHHRRHLRAPDHADGDG